MHLKRNYQLSNRIFVKQNRKHEKFHIIKSCLVSYYIHMQVLNNSKIIQKNMCVLYFITSGNVKLNIFRHFIFNTHLYERRTEKLMLCYKI